MTYFEEVAKSIVDSKSSGDKFITKDEMIKIVAEILNEINYAIKHDGLIYRP